MMVAVMIAMQESKNRSLKGMNMNHPFSVRSGTVSGLLTVILCNITTAEIAKIAVSAAIGTAVSFIISLLLKKLVRNRERP
jgi:hypothetical protein